ncbi:MAG: nitric oxide-sensing protein NosP [Polyangiaceae bacterium]
MSQVALHVEQTTSRTGIKRGASSSRDACTAARELYAAVAQPDPGLVVFFCSPEYDLDALAAELSRLFGKVNLVGCTTAGEISELGYGTGTLVGASFSAVEFSVATTRLDGLARFEFSAGEAAPRQLIEELKARGVAAEPRNTFGFLLVDGLSQQEESLVGALFHGLREIQLFGGSAGDGLSFGRTFIYHEGAFRQDCAILSLIHTERPFVVFKTQHFVSSAERMVVTEALPLRRIVTEINGEPAAREYARMVGLEVDKLTPMIFAAHPVVVKVGGDYYVRAIQKVNEDESLSFFCAIDEGVVLTVARAVDLIKNMQQAFDDVRVQIGTPDLVLGCDCILRYIEIGQRKLAQQAGQILRANNVVGFATYGEQFNAMHVNQTFTGVAIGNSR